MQSLGIFDGNPQPKPERFYVDDLKPGMILARDVFDKSHPQMPILFQKDTELTPDRIDRLLSRNVMEVYVVNKPRKKIR